MMKKTLLAAALATVSLPSVAEISGNVALTTDYRFRGISQTDRNPAVQGGFDWAHDSGFYLGTWGSNIAFAGSLELDYYGGYAGNITDNVAFDVGTAYYDYPGGGGNIEYWEFYGGLSGDLGPVSLSGTVYYSPDFFDKTGKAWYTDLGGSYSLPAEFTLNAHYGYQTIDKGNRFGINSDNYSDWSIGVSRSFMDLDFDLSYMDTDIDRSDCFGGDKACNDTFVFSVSKSL
jgi:uncharacterized protein (TIGR02001 family)